MDFNRIAGLLRFFVEPSELSTSQLESISTYIDLLIRWNARINLTAIRDAEEIVTRHFGESFFAARHLFPASDDDQRPIANDHLLDLGSGAGFPGIPTKIWAPAIHVTLVESQQKKATFLREACRSLRLTDIDVISTRAEQLPSATASVVALRAVERFASVLPVAARLITPDGRLALLIGRDQINSAKEYASSIHWEPEIAMPLSKERVLLIGTKKTNE
jgi:16S rRNA (guanine527-N7)-methyltransferase